MAREGLIDTSMAVGKVCDRWALRMAAPVMHEGHFSGALVGRVNLSQFADRVGHADAFLSDRNGVILLARDKTLELQALPGSAVATLDQDSRRLLYRQAEIPSIGFTVWDERYPELMLAAGRSVPVLLRHTPLRGGLLSYTVLWPVPEVIQLRTQRDALMIGAGLVGSLLILLVMGFLRHVTALGISHRETATREREFRTLVENLPNLVMRYERDGRCRYVNPAYAASTATERSVATLDVHLRDVMTTGDPVRFSVSWPRSGGGCVYHELYVVAERDADGCIVGALVIGNDVTERRRAEQALADARQFLDRVIDEIPDPVFVKDANFRWVLVNDAFCRMFGLPRDTLLGKCDFDIFPEHQARIVRDKDEVVLASGLDSVNEEKLTGADGVEHIIVAKKARYVDGHGDAFIVGSISDITARKQVESLLRAREREFRVLAENLPDVVVRYDRDCRRSYVSAAHERITGLPAHVVLGKSPMEYWSVPNGPEGAAAFQDHLVKVLTTGLADTWELSWSREDGNVVCMELRAVPEFDRNGHPVSVLTVARDVSAQREMEQYLRMAAGVFETAREGILITDPDGSILDVNPAFTLISGYSREEVLGHRPSILSSGRHGSDFYAAMWTTLKADGMWTGEVSNRRKGGEIYTEQLDIASVCDEKGAIRHYVGIFSDISQLKLNEQHLQHLAYHDALTGLPNRRLLTDRIQQAITQAKREGGMLALLYLDLDGFKPVNDAYGHEMGDRVLVEIAHRISAAVRASDTVARIGGDEFVALLVDQSNAKECEFTARRVLDAIARPVNVDGQGFNLSASIGISLYPDDDGDPDILLRYADQAMYLAKGAGRNQFVFHGSNVQENSHIDRTLVHDLREAIELDQLTVHYQPIVDMVSGQVVKAEALARWTHPQRGVVPPSVFIPVAEDAGLIHAIGDRVFTCAARVAREWNQLEPAGADGPRRISINRSPRQFFNRDGVSDWISHLIDEDISGEYLAVEITEGLLLDDRPDVLSQLNQLRAMGIMISLDDFGTGYSSLSYLKKFAIDYLKIDRSFVRDVVDDPSDRAIVESIIAMASRLGIKLIAEGVETIEQAELLVTAGCALAQGYYFARPMPEAEFLEFVTGPSIHSAKESLSIVPH